MVGCLVRSRMLWLLMCCCQNTRRRRLWQRMPNASKQRRSVKVVDHDSEQGKGVFCGDVHSPGHVAKINLVLSSQ